MVSHCFRGGDVYGFNRQSPVYDILRDADVEKNPGPVFFMCFLLSWVLSCGFLKQETRFAYKALRLYDQAKEAPSSLKFSFTMRIEDNTDFENF